MKIMDYRSIFGVILLALMSHCATYMDESDMKVNEIDIKPTERRKATGTEPNTAATKRKRFEDVDDRSDDEKQCNSELPSSSVTNKQIMEDSPAEVKPDIFPSQPPEDGLYHFLMGLYECIDGLDPIRKISVQARIYQILSQEVAASRATKNKQTSTHFS